MREENEIKVTVCYYKDRKNLVLRYIDPISNRHKTKSAKTGDEAEAIKAAGKWEDELRSGRYQPPNRMTWAEFRKRYEAEHLSTLALGTQITAKCSLDIVERELSPDRLSKLTSAIMSRFAADLRKSKTIRKEARQ